MVEKIKAIFTFEMLGRPPEHIIETLEKFINKIDEQKGMKVLSRKIHEPKPIEDENAKGLFTSFAEVELLLDNLNLAFIAVLNIMPANVEIVEPDTMMLKNFELTSVLSELAIKLHGYDDIARSALIFREKTLQKIKELEDKIKELEGGESAGVQGAQKARDAGGASTDVQTEKKKNKRGKKKS